MRYVYSCGVLSLEKTWTRKDDISWFAVFKEDVGDQRSSLVDSYR